MQVTCLNCGRVIPQTPKKRKKMFCDSTCRSNYWQKATRLEEKGLSPEEVINEVKKTNKKSSENKKPVETPIPTSKDTTTKDGINEYWKQRMAKKLGLK